MRLLVASIAMTLVLSCGGTAAPSATPKAAGVPCGPTEVFTRHEHAHLTMVVRGQLRVVPAFIGITATSIRWLHTHDTSGSIHIEAGDNRQFALGDFFSVWGKPLAKTALADDRASDGESVQATVNQKSYADPPETIVLHETRRHRSRARSTVPDHCAVRLAAGD